MINACQDMYAYVVFLCYVNIGKHFTGLGGGGGQSSGGFQAINQIYRLILKIILKGFHNMLDRKGNSINYNYNLIHSNAVSY